MCHKRIGYDLNVIRQYACLVINPVMVDNFVALFGCTPKDWASDSMMARPKTILVAGLGLELSSVAWSPGVHLMIIFRFIFPVVLFGRPGISNCHTTHCIC